VLGAMLSWTRSCMATGRGGVKEGGRAVPPELERLSIAVGQLSGPRSTPNTPTSSAICAFTTHKSSASTGTSVAHHTIEKKDPRMLEFSKQESLQKIFDSTSLVNPAAPTSSRSSTRLP
jgi:hypothetical protein